MSGSIDDGNDDGDDDDDFLIGICERSDRVLEFFFPLFFFSSGLLFWLPFIENVIILTFILVIVIYRAMKT